MNDAGWFRKREISDVAISPCEIHLLRDWETRGTTNRINLCRFLLLKQKAWTYAHWIISSKIDKTFDTPVPDKVGWEVEELDAAVESFEITPKIKLISAKVIKWDNGERILYPVRWFKSPYTLRHRHVWPSLSRFLSAFHSYLITRKKPLKTFSPLVYLLSWQREW